jgi:hypothetical protein
VARKTSSAGATPEEHLEALRKQPKETLAALLAELAAKHPEVSDRLSRHALAHDPARLAAAFREQLQSWQRPSRFLPRSDAAGYGRELENWLDEIERELLPLDPARAFTLAEAFLSSDLSALAARSEGATEHKHRAFDRARLHPVQRR